MTTLRRGGGISRATRRRLARRDPLVLRVLDCVAAEQKVRVEMLVARSRCRADLAMARRLAMYLMHVVLGRRMGTVAKLFRRHWSTVNRACYAIEDLREDAGFDRDVTRLEAMVVANASQVAKPRRARNVVAA